MGSEVTKSVRSCSFNSTDEGDDSPSQTQAFSSRRLSSPMENRESVKNFQAINSFQGETSNTRLPTPMSLCLIGDKQTGKTTLLNHLKGNSAAQSYPTHYPERTLLKRQVQETLSKTLVIQETDFETLRSVHGKSVLAASSGFLFVICYDQNANIRDQIRKIACLRPNLATKPFVILINNKNQSSPAKDSEQAKAEIKEIADQYSISPKDFSVFNKEKINDRFLEELIAEIEGDN